MLAVPILGIIMMSWWIRNLEKLTEDIRKKTSHLLSERIEMTGKNEIVFLQRHMDGLYGELQGKINELNEQSKALTEQKKRITRLEAMDELTSLLKRRLFDSKLMEEIKKAEKAKTEIGLLMIDVDGFKKYNQIHGHAAGDHLLKNLGLLIKDSVRKIGLPFRYGGDEFAVILPKHNIEQAAAVAQKIVDAASRITVKGEGEDASAPLSVSTGVVSYGKNYKGLFMEADRAVHEANSAGKGSVVCLTPEHDAG